ncbi:MAG: hypothetical protein Tsb0032_09440 [Kiloniellaceae bacterium]
MGKMGRGGEPNGARLLTLARAELLRELLPLLEGEARYRAKLIANAMKIAAREMERGEELDKRSGEDIAAFAARAGLEPRQGAAEAAGAIRNALRKGQLDGDSALHDLLCSLTQRRRELLG